MNQNPKNGSKPNPNGATQFSIANLLWLTLSVGIVSALARLFVGSTAAMIVLFAYCIPFCIWCTIRFPRLRREILELREKRRLARFELQQFMEKQKRDLEDRKAPESETSG